ncbi:MAG: hypothetical protein ACTHU0_22115 [Kofleriaceae bacterium]
MTDRKPIDMGGAFAGVPLCSLERCPSYDGKRCGETGNRPGDVCVPEVRAQRAEFVHLREQHARVHAEFERAKSALSDAQSKCDHAFERIDEAKPPSKRCVLCHVTRGGET